MCDVVVKFFPREIKHDTMNTCEVMELPPLIVNLRIVWWWAVLGGAAVPQENNLLYPLAEVAT